MTAHRRRFSTSTATATTATTAGVEEVRAVSRQVLRRLGIDLEVLHVERVPAEGGLVFMWNQESHLDHFVLTASLPRPSVSIYNNEVARVPLYGAHLRATGHIHVDRNDEAQWRASLADAAKRIHDGVCCVVSPEGTRSRDGNLLPMKRGAFLLAAASERPIVCVTVIGGHARLPRGAAAVRPGKMRVVFGEPIETRGIRAESGELQQRVVRAFEETKARYALR